MRLPPSAAQYFAIATSFADGLSSASRVAACHIVRLTASLSMYESAIRWPTAWNIAIGLSNCFRFDAYSAVNRTASWHAPAAIAQSPTIGAVDDPIEHRTPAGDRADERLGADAARGELHAELRLPVHRLLSRERHARRLRVDQEDRRRFRPASCRHEDGRGRRAPSARRASRLRAGSPRRREAPRVAGARGSAFSLDERGA